jgi:hypothetical protein
VHPIQPEFDGQLQSHKAADLQLDPMDEETLLFKIEKINAEHLHSILKNTSTDSSGCWKRGELKIFAWIALFYSTSQKL